MLKSEEPLRPLLSFLRSGLDNCSLFMIDGGGPVGDEGGFCSRIKKICALYVPLGVYSVKA